MALLNFQKSFLCASPLLSQNLLGTLNKASRVRERVEVPQIMVAGLVLKVLRDRTELAGISLTSRHVGQTQPSPGSTTDSETSVPGSPTLLVCLDWGLTISSAS